MKKFMDDGFLLRTRTAYDLFHEVAKDMPIYDFHCHLEAREIYENQPFRNLGHLMLGGDHYKWRAMAANGVPEELIRGDGDDYEKFLAYAGTLRYAPGSPLYHWTHLELRRAFGIEETLNKQTAPDIWKKAGRMLEEEAFHPRGLMQRFDVRLAATTDSPMDDLAYHERLAQDDSFPVTVVPAFRPDKLLHIERGGFVEQVALLGRVAAKDTLGFDGMIEALAARVDFFHARGARISDHALDTVPYAPPSFTIAREAFRKAMAGEALTEADIQTYQTCVLVSLARMYQEHGWVMQYHIGALRNVNPRMFAQYGADVGFDSMTDAPVMANLAKLLAAIDQDSGLPKTILYNLNPADNAAVAAMCGSFQGGGIPGKIQWGSAWWFNDTQEGMREQITTLASYGLLGRFVGMLTDSRSFLSYPRHEYFRRILCDVIGGWVEDGELPEDRKALKKLVRGICYENAEQYFGIDLKAK